MKTIFQKRMNRFCCKLAHVVHGAGGERIDFGVRGGQSSRSHDPEVRSGRLTEARVSNNQFSFSQNNYYSYCSILLPRLLSIFIFILVIELLYTVVLVFVTVDENNNNNNNNGFV